MSVYRWRRCDGARLPRVAAQWRNHPSAVFGYRLATSGWHGCYGIETAAKTVIISNPIARFAST